MQILRNEKLCVYERAADYISANSFLPSSNHDRDGVQQAADAARPGSAAQRLQVMQQARSCCNRLASELSELVKVRAVTGGDFHPRKAPDHG